jgi:hypothetical protein
MPDYNVTFVGTGLAPESAANPGWRVNGAAAFIQVHYLDNTFTEELSCTIAHWHTTNSVTVSTPHRLDHLLAQNGDGSLYKESFLGIPAGNLVLTVNQITRA